MPHIRALASIACILLLFTAGCDRGEPPAEVQPVEGAAAPIQFGRGRVTIETASDTFELGVEVAANEEQRSRGLMERQSLAADSGMIFLFQQPQPPTGVFWMFQTRIPLSIAFVGDDGRIGSIVEMEPCTSQFPQWCPNYEAGVPFVSALEVNAGYFRASNISVGDRVVLEQQ